MRQEIKRRAHHRPAATSSVCGPAVLSFPPEDCVLTVCQASPPRARSAESFGPFPRRGSLPIFFSSLVLQLCELCTSVHRPFPAQTYPSWLLFLPPKNSTASVPIQGSGLWVEAEASGPVLLRPIIRSALPRSPSSQAGADTEPGAGSGGEG